MSHRQPQKHVNMDHKSKYIPEHGQPDIEKNESEKHEMETPEQSASEPGKSGYNFDWILAQVNKYLESSRQFIKENSVEAATAAAATAGLAAWAALHSRSDKAGKPVSKHASHKAKPKAKKAQKLAVRKAKKSTSKRK